VTRAKSGLGPPPKPDQVAAEFVIITVDDLVQLALEAGLAPAAPREDWEGIAERLTSAFAGYAAGIQREDNEPANVPLRDWGSQLAGDARRLMARVGFDPGADDARQGTWRTSELAAECFSQLPDGSAPVAAALAELEQHLERHTQPSVGYPGNLNAEQLNVLIQRALFNLIPTLQILVLAGDEVQKKFGGAAKRGGSSPQKSVRWVFREIVRSFRALFLRDPKISPPGGFYRDAGGQHLIWFRLLLELVKHRIAETKGAEAEAIRDLADRALDIQRHDKNYDRLRAWVCEAAGQE